tara:strand:+ start:557 stop:1399 length:843 start_codon:yes stop_codon:yes gene_type:complete
MSKLNKKYESESEIPAWARSMFVGSDEGGWTAAEGVPAEMFGAGAAPGGGNDRLAEFRANNKKLTDELNATKSTLANMQKQYAGVDPEQFAKFQEQLSKVQEDEERKLIASGQIDEVVKRRTARLLDERNAELKQAKSAYEELSGQHKKLVGIHTTREAQLAMDRVIAENKLRVRSGAQEDLANRIASDWTYDADSKALKIQNQQLKGENGVDDMSPADYVRKELLGKRSFFFEAASGGGAGGGESSDVVSDGAALIKRDPMAIGRNLEDIAAGKKRIAR